MIPREQFFEAMKALLFVGVLYYSLGIARALAFLLAEAGP